MIRNHVDDEGKITKDSCWEGGISLAKTFDAVVIQSSYVNYVKEMDQGRLLGGIVVVDSDGTVLRQASYDAEEHLLYDTEN